ncbi:unnamed protein product [Chondrus crispus]|uniref:Uncharacterized protein n=1 Tax=Chondrus crispus TaxID=2769 RepID=R7Q3Z4_CHOCR|nr:unnamed protein product [Chondrus crispus]CDF32744.1 unnamed protein product [Chondrus crispus]|eukprot:XP_005712515.1 unnamed protein product [Chondrus crispus]
MLQYREDSPNSAELSNSMGPLHSS